MLVFQMARKAANAAQDTILLNESKAKAIFSYQLPTMDAYERVSSGSLQLIGNEFRASKNTYKLNARAETFDYDMSETFSVPSGVSVSLLFEGKDGKPTAKIQDPPAKAVLVLRAQEEAGRFESPDGRYSGDTLVLNVRIYHADISHHSFIIDGKPHVYSQDVSVQQALKQFFKPAQNSDRAQN